MPNPNWDQLTFLIPDIKEQSLTALSMAEELEFQKWIKDTSWYKEYLKSYNEEPNLNDPNYDYRAAWKSGIVPEINSSDNKYHWSDFGNDKMLKSPNHPTAWAQFFMNQFGINPDILSKDDARVKAYQNAWYKKYPPRY